MHVKIMFDVIQYSSLSCCYRHRPLLISNVREYYRISANTCPGRIRQTSLMVVWFERVPTDSDGSAGCPFPKSLLTAIPLIARIGVATMFIVVVCSVLTSSHPRLRLDPTILTSL